MFAQLVESIEKEFQSTTKTKNELHIICDVSWKLLRPPGSGNRGKFIVEKPITNTEMQHNSGGCSSLSQDEYRDVTDLVNHAKLVRATENVGNVRDRNTVPKKSANNEKSSLTQIKPLEKTPVRSRCLTVKTGRSSSVSLDSNMKPRSCSMNRNNNTEKVEVNKNGGMKESTHRMSSVISYSHTCSSTLSVQSFSFKMSEDLSHMLKQFYSYVNLRTTFPQNMKTKHQDFEDIFSSRLRKYAKLKLQNDLQNTNQYEKYITYVEVAEKAIEKRSKHPDPNMLVLHYRSQEQLHLFEAKYHKLLELQLQSKLLNSIIGYFSASHY